MLIGQTWVTRPPGPGGRRGPRSSREPRVGGGVSTYQQLQGSAAATAPEPYLALGLFLSYPQAKNNFYILKDLKKKETGLQRFVWPTKPTIFLSGFSQEKLADPLSILV